MEIPKTYNPEETEGRIYKLWEDSGFFNPDKLPKEHKEHFCIVLPPPNATGILHMGSAMMLAVEDIIIRYQRMRGKKTLWLPGTDHAAIATHSKVEALLAKEEGKTRHDIGREQFVKKIEQFVEKNRDTMRRQIKKMGASVDWSREAFTLDKKRSLAVRTAFKNMYDAGLIYRGERVINWDVKGQTAVSDDEVEHKEIEGRLYTFKYAPDFPIAIATTRPETKVGDTAVAVHPNDKRYEKFLGKEYDIEFAGAKLHIRIIADESIDPEFGTGAVGITPAHSIIDSEIAARHHIKSIQIINESGLMTKQAGSLVAGKSTKEARELVIKWLKDKNLLEKEEAIPINIAKSYRTGGVIEPLPKEQWFIDVNKKIPKRGNKSLRELMHDAVADKKIKIIPERFEKIYFHWIDNLRDWNISRQIWYGHRIPVWYKAGKIYCGINPPKEKGWEQDPDTLDTWFSSGLWTFSTLGWPEFAQSAVKGRPGQENDFANYHPTDVLETAYDIIFFWVARMILMSEFHLGDIPFKTVYLHGIVRDEKNRKISKSLGNNMDPIDIAKEYGADAVRMSLIVGTSPGNDSKISYSKLKAYKHFSNKVWNISRFILMQLDSQYIHKKPELSKGDESLINELHNLAQDITKDMENYRFYLAAEKLYHYIWHQFADKILEDSKKALYGNDEGEKKAKQWLLVELLQISLKLLHPFIPFITEEIWSRLPMKNKKLLIIEDWPCT